VQGENNYIEKSLSKLEDHVNVKLGKHGEALDRLNETQQEIARLKAIIGTYDDDDDYN
jgi:hypothetical protein